MTYWDELSAQERAELDAAVTAAYVRADGSVRSHGEAIVRFLDVILPDAIQAHRRWAGLVHDEATRRGVRSLIQGRWKSMAGVFHGVIRGKSKVRPMRRGVERVDTSTGDRTWTQMEIVYDTAEDLQRKIAEAARNIEEQRSNITFFRRLLDLLERTGEPTVERGLATVGLTLDEYLAADEQVAT